MPAYVDPKSVNYAPESLPESQNVGTVAVGGTVVARYMDWPPYYVEMENLVVEHGAQNETVIVSADGYARKMHYHTRADPLDTWAGNHVSPNKVLARDSMELMINPESGVADTDITARWNMSVRDPTVLDKLRIQRVTNYPVNFTAAERALIEKYDLEAIRDIGVMPRNENLLGDNVFKWFDEIQQVARRIPAIANGEELVVGGELKVPYEKLYVLLGISFDSVAATASGLAASELWIKVDRDAKNDYIVMDAVTMPEVTAADMTDGVRMFVPALEKMRVRLDNQSGGDIAAGDALNLRFIYGIRDLTIIDHLKWNYPFFKESDEARAIELDEKYQIRERIAAGLIDNYQPAQIQNLKL